MAREIRVTLGPPRDRGIAVVVPVSWQSSGLPALFPVLDGDVELLPRNPDYCRVSLFASYVPPFGQLGGQLNRALLHHVAQSTVRSFLVRMAESLEDENLDRWPATSRFERD